MSGLLARISMPWCDHCFKDLNGSTEVLLKQQCNHRIHAKCESKEGECPACKTQNEMNKCTLYSGLILLGVLVGVCCILSCLGQDKTNSMHAKVRELEAGLAMLELWAERSFTNRALVQKSLTTIHAAIKKELTNLQAVSFT